MINNNLNLFDWQKNLLYENNSIFKNMVESRKKVIVPFSEFSGRCTKINQIIKSIGMLTVDTENLYFDFDNVCSLSIVKYDESFINNNELTDTEILFDCLNFICTNSELSLLPIKIGFKSPDIYFLGSRIWNTFFKLNKQRVRISGGSIDQLLVNVIEFLVTVIDSDLYHISKRMQLSEHIEMYKSKLSEHIGKWNKYSK